MINLFIGCQYFIFCRAVPLSWHVIKNVFISQGTFDLEEWKRFYSNNEEEDSVKYFWQHFDPDHYSIWRGDYR